MLLSPQVELSEGASSCVEFEAELFVLYSTGSGMKPGFQGTVYVASTVQNAVVQRVKQKVGWHSSSAFLVFQCLWLFLFTLALYTSIFVKL